MIAGGLSTSSVGEPGRKAGGLNYDIEKQAGGL